MPEIMTMMERRRQRRLAKCLACVFGAWLVLAAAIGAAVAVARW